MPNSKELELERQALLMEMAAKVDFIYNLLRQATITEQAPTEDKKSEPKKRKKAKKAE